MIEPSARVVRPPAAPDLGVRALGEGDQCTNGNVTVNSSPFLYRTIEFWVDGPTLTDDEKAAVRIGARGWTDTRNTCGFGDQNNLTLQVNEVLYTLPDGFAFDGKNMVGKADMSFTCGGVDVLACATYWTYPGQSRIEADIMFNSTGPCRTLGTAPACADNGAVATHEFGHAIGLEHTSAQWLVMYPFIHPNTTFQRNLGLGDRDGLRTLYPAQ